MKVEVCLLFGLLFVLVKFSSAHSACSSKYPSKMMALLDTVASSLRNAWNLTEDLDTMCQNDIKVCDSKPLDCEDILSHGNHKSGIYSVNPRSRVLNSEIQVACDMDTDGGGWTVIQRRGNFGRPKDYFFKGWNDYKMGFGRKNQDFWLGNDNIHAITNQKAYTLRIEIMDLQKEKRYALYDYFWIDSEEHNYTLHVKSYSGNAGDAFSGHNGMQFSTKDKENDIHPDVDCAHEFKGGWWYSKCHSANLNGLYLNGPHFSYADGIEWTTWRGQNYSFPFVEMKIRSSTFVSKLDQINKYLTPK